MAKLVQAVARYCPRVVGNRTAHIDEVAEFLANGSGQTKAQVLATLYSLQAVIVFYNRSGTAVKLPGIGTFRPHTRMSGQLRTAFRPDPTFRSALNAAGAFRGNIANREHVGLSKESLKELWDAEFPEDPLELA